VAKPTKQVLNRDVSRPRTPRLVSRAPRWRFRMGVSWPAVEAALRTDPHRLPPALLADVQQHLEGLVFGPASQQPLNLSWSPPRFECAAAYMRCTHDAQGECARLTPCFALRVSLSVATSSRRCEMPRPAGQPPRRIIDIVPFSYELDVLELRLHELNATVDLFVVVEAPVTHRGLRKPLVFAQHAKRFAAFAHKIVHVVVPHAISPSRQPRPSPQPQPQPRPSPSSKPHAHPRPQT
jgi:hypothetical protein